MNYTPDELTAETTKAGLRPVSPGGSTAQWQLLVPESWEEPPCAGRKRQL